MITLIREAEEGSRGLSSIKLRKRERERAKRKKKEKEKGEGLRRGRNINCGSSTGVKGISWALRKWFLTYKALGGNILPKKPLGISVMYVGLL
jgi:hypothetical protein